MKTTTLKSVKIELSLKEEETLFTARNILENIMEEAYKLGERVKFNTSIGEELYTEDFQNAVQFINSILDVDLVVIIDDED